MPELSNEPEIKTSEAAAEAAVEEKTETVTENADPNLVPNKKRKKKDKNKIIAIIVLLLLLICGGIFVYTKFFAPKSDIVSLEDSIRAELGQLDGKTEAEIEEELNKVVEDGEMMISINMNPVFADGTSEGSLRIENSPANKYVQKVVITLDDTGEEVYDSGAIPPNYHIDSDVLSVDLDAGEYEATATFTAYDEDTGLEIGSAAAKIEITVLE